MPTNIVPYTSVARKKSSCSAILRLNASKNMTSAGGL